MIETNLTEHEAHYLILLCGIIGAVIGGLFVWLLMRGESEQVGKQKKTITGLEKKITEREKQITTKGKQIEFEQSANAALTNKLAESQNDIDKVTSEYQGQLNRLMRTSVDASLVRIKGVGASSAEKFKEAGFPSIFDIAEMTPEQLEQVQTEAKLPASLRKYDIIGEVKVLVSEFEQMLQET